MYAPKQFGLGSYAHFTKIMWPIFVCRFVEMPYLNIGTVTMQKKTLRLSWYWSLGDDQILPLGETADLLILLLFLSLSLSLFFFFFCAMVLLLFLLSG